jgi:hypothetical protein
MQLPGGSGYELVVVFPTFSRSTGTGTILVIRARRIMQLPGGSGI